MVEHPVLSQQASRLVATTAHSSSSEADKPRLAITSSRVRDSPSLSATASRNRAESRASSRASSRSKSAWLMMAAIAFPRRSMTIHSPLYPARATSSGNSSRAVDELTFISHLLAELYNSYFNISNLKRRSRLFEKRYLFWRTFSP